MHVSVRLFARLRDLAGTPEMQVEIPEGSQAQTLWERIAREYPALESYTGSVSCAVNEEYAKLSTRLKNGDEIAFLPPVSGG